MRAITLGLFLFATFLFTTPTAFSYNGEVLDENNRAMFVEAQANYNDGKFLIPTTAILKGNDTKYYTYRYSVEVSSELELVVELDDIFVNNSREYSDELQDVFNFDITYRRVDEDRNIPYEFNNDTYEYEVLVIVTMNEPSDVEQYKLVTENDITVDFVFKAL